MALAFQLHLPLILSQFKCATLQMAWSHQQERSVAVTPRLGNLMPCAVPTPLNGVLIVIAALPGPNE